MKKIKKGLKNLLYTGAITLASLLPNTAISQDLPTDPKHPMYGLNQFVPAHTPEFTYDWYGSGDANGDEKIDQADMDYMNSHGQSNDPYNDGSHRMDLDLDGDSNDADDKAIFQKYLDGEITHINQWELETPEEQLSHLKKALAIDSTDQNQYIKGSYECGSFSTQLYINLTGIYNIEDYFGTNSKYNITHNGIFRIPLNLVSTKYVGNSTITTAPGGHAINAVFIRDKNNPDPKDFTQYVFIEPQTDEIIEKGNASLNEYANLSKYVYAYSPAAEKFKYFETRTIEFTFNDDGTVSTTVPNSNYVDSWTPATETIPETPQQELYKGIENDLEKIAKDPENVYPGVKFTKTVTTDRATADVWGKDNYTATVQHGFKAGEKTWTKTGTFPIRDTQKPYLEGNEWKDASSVPLLQIINLDAKKGTDPWKANYYQYDVVKSEQMEDISENRSVDEKYLETTVQGELPTGTITAPADYVTTVAKGTTLPTGTDETGKATVTTTQNAPYELVVWDKRTSKTDEKEEYERTHSLFYATATDSIKVKQKLTYNIDLGQDPLNLQKTYNPTNNTLELKTLGNGNFNLDLDIYYVFGGKKASLDPVARDYTGKGATHTYDLTALEGKLVDIRILATKTGEKDREILKVK